MKLSELIEEAYGTKVVSFDDVTAAITARLRECVKPLEWVGDDPEWRMEADIAYGTYSIYYTMDDQGLEGWCAETPLADLISVEDTRKDAKAAAQAHYTAQIIAGLDT